MFWTKNPAIAIRTRLSASHVMARVSGHIAERGTSASGLELASGRVGANTFTVRYWCEGVRYKVLGRVREGRNDRLVLLRVQRLPEKPESIAWALLAGASVWFGSRGLEVSHDFAFGGLAVVSAVVSGRMMPRWHRVPTEMVRALQEDYLRVLDAAPEDSDVGKALGAGRRTMQ